jgi:hypothetical protein
VNLRKGPGAWCGALWVLAGLGWTWHAPAAQTFTPPVKSGPTTSRSTPPEATAAGGAKVLLIDDDESDNNSNPASAKLSASDKFYRQLLQGQGFAFDTVIVPKYADGPSLDKLKRYQLIIWYTGASYGGNPDNTAVISLKDEQTLSDYLHETGGSVILFSPGYLNNALGAGGAALWEPAAGAAPRERAGRPALTEQNHSTFLQQVVGIRGGRGLLQRFTDGTVDAAGGGTYAVTKNPTVETQFSVANPLSAQALYTTKLDPDGKGVRPVAVATSNGVGAGHFVYVGFTFENVGQNATPGSSAGAAFNPLLKSIGAPATLAASAPRPAGSSGSSAQEAQWPASFELLAGESAEWGFVVGQSGEIEVRVQTQGAVVAVGVRRPDGTIVERTGTGDINISIHAGPSDLARSVIWAARVRDGSGPVRLMRGARSSVSVARGTIAVTHPPADTQRADAELRKFSAEAAAAKASLAAVATPALRPGPSPPGPAAPLPPAPARILKSVSATPNALVDAPITRNAPVIQAVEPASGSSGTVVTLTGHDFGPGMFMRWCNDFTAFQLNNPDAFPMPDLAPSYYAALPAGYVLSGKVVFVLPGRAGGEYEGKWVGDDAQWGGLLRHLAARCRAVLLDPEGSPWNDTRVQVLVPQMPVLGWNTETRVYVRTATQSVASGVSWGNLASAPATFHYTAETGWYWKFGLPGLNSYSKATLVMDRQIAAPFEVSGGWHAHIIHAGTLTNSVRGDDEFSAPPLQGGWVVDKCAIWGTAMITRGPGIPGVVYDHFGERKYDTINSGYYYDYFVYPGQDTWADSENILTIWFPYDATEDGTSPAILGPGLFGDLGSADAAIVDCPVGSTTPHIKVHWWAGIRSSVTYNVGIKIRGPGGRPFQ